MSSKTHKTHEYPNCEEDDCYCRNHWPNRSGGEEHKVVDNRCDGAYTIRCDVAIDNNDKIRTCSFCQRFMLGTWLPLCDEKEMCYRCWDDTPLTPILKEILNTLCKRCAIFPECEEDIDMPRKECVKCGKVHIVSEPEEGSVIPECESVVMMYLKGLFKSFGSLHTDVQNALYCVTKGIEKKYKEVYLAQREKKNAAFVKQQELEERCSSTRKRLLKSIIPMFSVLSDKDLETLVPAKFMRVHTEQDIETADRLCSLGENPFTTEDVVALAELLYDH